MNGNVFIGKKAIFNGDISANGNLVVYGNLTVQQASNNNFINTTITNYQLVVTDDISLNGRLSVSSDASLNGNLYVNLSTVLNNGLTVSGGTIVLPNASISDSALSGNIVTQTYADSTYLTIASASGTYLTTASAQVLYQPSGNYQPAGSYLTTASAQVLYQPSGDYQPAGSYLTTASAEVLYQPSGSYLTTASAEVLYQPSGNYQLAGSYLTTASAEVLYQPSGDYQPAGSYLTTASAEVLYQPSGSYLTTASGASTYLTITSASGSYLTTASAQILYQQAGSYLTTASGASIYAPKQSPTFTGTVSLNDISANGNLVIRGNLTVQQGSNNINFINTTVTNYQLVITDDISLNGRLSVSNDASLNGRLYVRGNVGIGTTSPAYTLDVSGALNVNGSIITTTGVSIAGSNMLNFGYNLTKEANAGKIGYGAFNNNSCLDIVGAGTGVIRSIQLYDHIGIGTGAPAYPLHIMSAVNGTYNPNSSTVYTANGNPNGISYIGPWTPPNVSIYCSGLVVAVQFNAYSDERIKTNINDMDNNESLIKLRKLKPKTYNYIDIVNNSNQVHYGFIAQEVESIIPHSITKIKDFIPNIYDLADVVDSYTISLKTKSTALFVPDASGTILMKLYDASNNAIETKITNIIDEKTFQVSHALDETQIFVYGQQVDDFRSLHKDSIFTVTTAAVQAIDAIVQAQQETIISLEAKNIDLENRLSAIEARLMAAGI
jgi:hypothetical protein